MTTDRLSKLHQLLAKTPDDPFLLYAIALEHKKSGDFAEAVRQLQLTLQKDPGYVVAYLQMGQTHVEAGDIASARKAFTDGIAAARKKGDNHAASEMEQMLGLLR
ncbi:MAG: tetratricopeptide repeat protein [Tepidisphaerales bacterium]